MDNLHDEPQPAPLSHVEGPALTARPFSTPHSAPAHWLGDGPAAAEPETPAPPISNVATRHDGWTGEKMAIFCEALAETAVVAEACEEARMGISGAYAARRRNPVFAAAWDAALTIARERLADTLLARSMEGNVEQIYRDGELVGERHVLDNRLGLAILRRLDRLAETGLSLHSNLQEPKPPAVVSRAKPFDWKTAIEALRTGDDAGVAAALAMAKGSEVEEVEDPLNRPPSPSEEDSTANLWDRCWEDDETLGERVWMTDFPPPEGFAGYEEGQAGAFGYKRECTEEESALLTASARADDAEDLAADAELRDAWFALLLAELPGTAPPTACASAGAELTLTDGGDRYEGPRT